MIVFDKTKKYKISISHPEKGLLNFEANNVETTEILISFTDKYNQRLVFGLEYVMQAKEARK